MDSCRPVCFLSDTTSVTSNSVQAYIFILVVGNIWHNGDTQTAHWSEVGAHKAFPWAL